MLENLVVSAWIGVRASCCAMTYCISTDEDVDIMLDDGGRRCEFAIEAEALRSLLEVGGQVLAELDARTTPEAAVQSELAAAQECSA